MSKADLNFKHIGHEMHQWASELFPICRSLTGEGVRQTLSYFQTLLPGLTIKSVPSGTKVFDWTIPKEWRITDAFIANEAGERIVDFNQSNLHVVGYSAPVDRMVTLEELNEHLYSIPEMPDAIPYITSYYQPRWGFCLTQKQRDKLEPGQYHVKIDSELFDGQLNYAELLIPGDTDEEILISSYVCHPSLANNELSGPVVTVALARILQNLPNRRYSYRIVLVPETIGAITYLSQNLLEMKRKVVAGYVLTCIGDNRTYSYLQSRAENTLSDRAAMHTMRYIDENYRLYNFLHRGSDERQYCAPGIDLPIGSIMRTKYGDYPEYHTSLDDLALISPTGLQGGLEATFHSIMLIEYNKKYRVTTLGEPQLGKRGLYPTLSNMFMDYSDVKVMTDLIAYCDGEHDLIDVANKINADARKLIPIIAKLLDEQLLEIVEQ